jgi:hypothetical protein
MTLQSYSWRYAKDMNRARIECGRPWVRSRIESKTMLCNNMQLLFAWYVITGINIIPLEGCCNLYSTRPASNFTYRRYITITPSNNTISQPLLSLPDNCWFCSISMLTTKLRTVQVVGNVKSDENVTTCIYVYDLIHNIRHTLILF